MSATLEMLDTKTIIDAFSKVLNTKGGTIVDVAKILHTSVAEISKYVDAFSKQNEQLDALFRQRKWPRNVVNGYIFTGAGNVRSPYAERQGELKPGMHVFTEQIKNDSKRHEYYFIYLSIPIVEKKYTKYKVRLVNDKWITELALDRDGKKIDIWLQDGYEFDSEKEELFKRRIVLQDTGITRIVHIKDKWAGEADSYSLVSVNREW